MADRMGSAGLSVRAALLRASEQLSAVSDSPRLDAELLMAHALGCERDRMQVLLMENLAPAAFDTLVARRIRHEPVAYITGTRAFWTIDLTVGPGVLIPRPDSETLIEAAIESFGEASPKRILDLGTGPGTLLLAALDQWPEASGVGVDQSEVALRFARQNAEILGMGARSVFQQGDWGRGLTNVFDLILSNPPYIGTDESLPNQVKMHEPSSALFAGVDGLEDYHRIIPDLRRLLMPGGIAILEIGWTQADAVSEIARAEGFSAMVRKDLGGRDRAIVLG